MRGGERLSRSDQRRPSSTSLKGEDIAAYVASLAGDLRELARRNGLTTLAYLLDMARLEAEAEIRAAREAQEGSSVPEIPGE